MFKIVVAIILTTGYSFVPYTAYSFVPNKSYKTDNKANVRYNSITDTDIEKEIVCKTIMRTGTTSFKYVGDLPPLNYFDLLQISTNLEDSKLKYVREAELQHCRVAMVAFVSLFTIDHLSGELAINYLYNMPLIVQSPFWIGVGAYEYARMRSGWENPFSKNNLQFKLKLDYQPGNLYNINTQNITNTLLNKELSNGRLAMIASFGYIAQEFITGEKPF